MPEGEFKRLIRKYDENADELMRNSREAADMNFSFPAPLNLEDAFKRTEYKNFPLFIDRYAELLPILEQLDVESTAIVEKPKMVFTDKEFGMFSMDRFMMGIYPIMAFWSESNKEFIQPKMVYYSLKYKKVVPSEDVIKEESDNGGLIFKLKKDKSEVVQKQNIVTTEKDGAKKYTLLSDGSKLDYKHNGKYGTKNKKVYYVKLPSKMPYKSVRLFVQIGNNAGKDTVNTGILASAIAKYLESLGFAIRITIVINNKFQDGRTNPKTGTKSAGYRCNIFDVKKYTDTLDLSSLLYTTADSSFFRVKHFRYNIAEQFYFYDTLDSELGGTVSLSTTKEMLIDAMKRKDLECEEDTLYYFVGGSGIQSFDDAKAQITQTIREVNEDNRRALERVKSITL